MQDAIMDNKSAHTRAHALVRCFLFFLLSLSPCFVPFTLASDRGLLALSPEDLTLMVVDILARSFGSALANASIRDFALVKSTESSMSYL